MTVRLDQKILKELKEWKDWQLKLSFMYRTLELAKKGNTAPNPMVGAVLVKKDKIIAEGFHSYAGGPHAEVVALRKAGKKAKGADLYVNLEPCCHQGRTPPCLSLIHI